MRQKINRLINWSERHAKADMRYFLRGNFWVVSGQVANSVLSFLLLLVFANYLPKETYGLYRYILSLASVLNIFTLTGMNQAVSQSVAAGNDGALKTSIGYQLKWNLLMMVAAWALGAYYFVNHNSQLALAFVIMGVFSPLTAVFNTYGAYLDGKKEFRLNNFFSILSTLIYSVGMALTIILSGEVIALVIAFSVTTLITNLFFYWVTIKKFKPPISTDYEVLKYGRELTFIGFIGPIVSQLDKIILNHFWGPAQLAIYSLATAIPDRATSFIKSWVNIGFPKFAVRTTKEINLVFSKRIALGFLVGGICSILYIITAPFVFKYLLPQYLDTVFYSQLLAISLLFAMPNRYLSLLLAAKKLSKLIFWNSIIQNSIRVLLYIFLGIYGGVLGLVIAYITNNFIALIINIWIWKFKTTADGLID